ncbi:MAG: type II toxin-antitoxin system VapC family toxin [Saprospiraceae bacterium]|nr:type II toxin-antitoxin system VapC family toxin [Saprospiraceae bacterium]
MASNIQKIFLDTSFLIRLFKKDTPEHENAKSYFRRFRSEKCEMFLSTIVAAEYGAGADIKLLPYRDLTVLPFNLNHAERSSALAKLAFENKKKGVIVLENRVVIPNDTKLLAQAEEVSADIFIARDDNCEKVYRLMKDNGLVSFNYLDLKTPPNEFFAELFNE